MLEDAELQSAVRDVLRRSSGGQRQCGDIRRYGGQDAPTDSARPQTPFISAIFEPPTSLRRSSKAAATSQSVRCGDRNGNRLVWRQFNTTAAIGCHARFRRG